MFDTTPSLDCAGRLLKLDRPRICGVLNLTGDSFSGDGLGDDVRAAVGRGLEMVEQGADLLDVGAESTRPGAEPVDAQTEISRVVPVIEMLARESGVPISIDSSKPEVMRAAVAAGAGMINDIYALRREGALDAAAELKVPVCLMHMQGEPRTMQDNPVYDDVVSDVKRFLEERVAFAIDEGVREELICVDPGIGFGKTVAQNFELLRRLDELAALGRPVLVGVSRKSSLGRIMGDAAARTGTIAASVGAAVAAYGRGATILRVHDVREHVEALTAARAVAVGV